MVERSITGVLVTSLTTVTKALLERALTGRHDVAVRRFATAPDPFPSHR
jgi:hypothetical protein